MRLKLSLVLAVLLFAVPAAASAQQTFDYTGHSGVVSGNVYVGPYTGTLGGVEYDIFCVDGLTNVRTSAYQANITSLISGDLTDTKQWARFGTYGLTWNTYAQAAWLALQFDATPTTQWGAIHQAIWDITGGLESGASTGWAGTSLVADLKTRASTEYDDGLFNAAEWSVITPVDGVTSQEFLVRNSVVPEPETWAMLLAGLVAVGGVAFRRRSLGAG